MKADFMGKSEEAEKAAKIVKAADQYFIDLERPREFRLESPENEMKEMDVSFENLCASMEEAGVSHPNKLTVFQFNQRIEYFQKKKSRRE